MTQNKKVTLLGSALTAVLAGIAPALQAGPIIIFSGDVAVPDNNGAVQVGVDGYGNFGGTDNRLDTGTALLREQPPSPNNPPTQPGFENTTNTSYVALRFADSLNPQNPSDPFAGQLPWQAQLIGTGTITTGIGTTFTGLSDVAPNPPATDTTVETTFKGNNFGTSPSGINYSRDIDFQLTQTIEPYANSSGGTSTMLLQKYVLTNNTAEEIAGELLRYANFDLEYGTTAADGAGLVVDNNGRQFLMTTRSSLSDTDLEPVYAAISAEIDGQTTTNDRYRIDLETNLPISVLDGNILGNPVPLDNYVIGVGSGGPLDQDNLAPGGGNYALALRNAFVIGAAGSGNNTLTYITGTYWGKELYSDFDPPPLVPPAGAPTVGTLPLIGLATLGLAAVGRRRKQQT